MIQSFPFSALVGQNLMKRALLLNVIDPSIGGVLIKGERGTAKSTGVRALAGLLPTIRVVSGCPFHCDPDDIDGFCPHCRESLGSGQPIPVLERGIRLVNLPIGTTEDRLLGAIDIEKALKSGQKAFEPGLLAEAHRGILYVDEVNLLNDQIVDLFLDAAASGRNLVEREGISFSHASRFVLVGTMNPEEGDLRPQLLDRFGLSVSIEGIHTLSERVEIVKRRLSFEQNPRDFRAIWAQKDAELARNLVRAKESLPQVTFTEAILETSSRLAMAMETDGHRADIVMMKSARANAALEGRSRVSPEDLQLAARLALPHRIGKSPLRRSELSEDKLQEIMSQASSLEGAGEEWSPTHQNPPRSVSRTRACQSPIDAVTHLCKGSRTVHPDIPWHRIMAGSHRGRRFLVPAPQRGGTVHGSRIPRGGEALRDVSLMGTLRAAAPRQQNRGNGDVSPRILADDLRIRKRSRKTGLSLVMIVDSSASMRTNDRMSVTKGIIEALFQDMYLRRDKLGIITFRHTGAEVILPLSQNIRDAVDGIERLPVGGRTPLAAGLDLGIRMLTQEKRKNPETLPVMLIFSDGRPNISCFGGDPLEEALRAAEEIRRLGIQSILVDTEFNPMAVGYGYEITQRMGGTYLTMDRLHTK
ncbi:MAG: VWA domain-containing protein [Syntrophobacteraceae bacterium]|jgi:magnesium chelatase subunit D|nr:VWA domain-containing protein [Syntrophobacteraceae bacterium]